MAAVPQPGAIPALVEAGSIVSLEDLGFDIDELNATLGESFVALGEYEGSTTASPPTSTSKSMVWYPKDDFDAAGYEVPETFDDLVALSDQIVEDGSTPWCVGFESEGATGWPATDWMEDIMLRTAGRDVYDQWVAHEIPFNDDAVVHAGEIFGQIMFGDGYVLGGADNTPSIAFGDAPLPMFDDPPGCWLHRQASFINASFPETAEAGVDYDWFPSRRSTRRARSTPVSSPSWAPTATGPRSSTSSKRFISDRGAVRDGRRRRRRPASRPTSNVGPDCYSNDILADASVVLTDSLADGSGRFDASDLMPAEVGSGSFWTGMIEYMQGGPDSLQGVLDDIEASWPSCPWIRRAAVAGDRRRARRRRLLGVVRLPTGQGRQPARGGGAGHRRRRRRRVPGVLGHGPAGRRHARPLPGDGPALRVRGAGRRHPRRVPRVPGASTRS